MSTEQATQEQNQEMEESTEVVPVEKVAIVKLLKDFPSPVIMSILTLVEYHTSLLEKTKQELEQAQRDLQTTQECLEAAEELEIKALISRHRRVKTRIEKEIEFLKKRATALESGYLAIPRFDYASIEWSSERMNYQTLKRLKEAKEAGIFDEFGVVQDKYTRPRSARDPFLVGILAGARNHEEHFFIGAWH